MNTAREIDFEVPVEDGKYTIRFFKDPENGVFDILRFDEPWLAPEGNMPGSKMLISMAFELHAFRTGQGEAVPTVPLVLADEVIKSAKLPTDFIHGRDLLPVPIDKVRAMIALAVTKDRNRRPFSPAFFAEHAWKSATVMLPEYEHFMKWLHQLNYEQFAHWMKGVICGAVRYAQSCGARATQGKPLAPEDYEEAVRNAMQSFSATLYDKGVLK